DPNFPSGSASACPTPGATTRATDPVHAGGAVVDCEGCCDHERPRTIRHVAIGAVARLQHVACLHVGRVLPIVGANVEVGLPALLLQADDADCQRDGVAALHQAKGDG